MRINFVESIRRWWWWLFTGHDSLEANRRAIEEDARRFGGEVHWASDELQLGPRKDDQR